MTASLLPARLLRPAAALRRLAPAATAALRPLSIRATPPSSSNLNTFALPSISSATLVSAQTKGGWGSTRRVIMTAPPSSTAAAVSGEFAPILSRLQHVEHRLESNSLTTLQSIQTATVEVEKCRAQLAEMAKRQAADGEALKKAAGSQFLINGFVLIYLFTICTWMLLLLTDLSGHMHGIPVVRMVTLRPDAATTATAKSTGERNREHDRGHAVELPVMPEDGLLDVNTVPEPHLATSK